MKVYELRKMKSQLRIKPKFEGGNCYSAVQINSYVSHRASIIDHYYKLGHAVYIFFLACESFKLWLTLQIWSPDTRMFLAARSLWTKPFLEER